MSKIDYIKNENYNLITYPEQVIAKVKKKNNDFINISYDFTKTEAARAAYIRFKNPIELDEKSLKVSFDVISKESISDYIKLKITDANGETKLIMAQRGFDESDDPITLTIPLTTIDLPAKITDIYVGQDTKDILSSGDIQIGNITIMSKTDDIFTDTKPPIDIKGIDSANPTVDKDGSFKIAIYDKVEKPTILLDKLKNSKLENEINKNANLVVFTSQTESESEENITVPIIKPTTYSKTSYENFDLITLDVSNGGLRNSDYTQWINIQNDVKNSKNKNILIIMKGNLNDFTDKNERQLFIDVMCDLRRDNNKNVWIITDENYTTYKMERGVKYLSVNNENIEPEYVSKETSYILISVDKNNFSYEVKNLF